MNDTLLAHSMSFASSGMTTGHSVIFMRGKCCARTRSSSLPATCKADTPARRVQRDAWFRPFIPITASIMFSTGLTRCGGERGHVDISGLEAEADVLNRTGHLLDELIASETVHESLLAVRVVLRGRTALHSRLFSDPDRLTAEVRNVATERGGDRIWIEKVELQLEPPRNKAMIDGPIDELLEVVEQLRHDRSSLDSVLLELAELKAQASLGAHPRSRWPTLERCRLAAILAGARAAVAARSAGEVASGILKRRCLIKSSRHDPS